MQRGGWQAILDNFLKIMLKVIISLILKNKRDDKANMAESRL